MKEKKKNLTHAHQLENKTNKKKSNTHTNTRTTSIRPQPFPQNTISCRTPPQKPRNIVHDTEQLNSQSCDAPSRKLKNQKKRGKKRIIIIRGAGEGKVTFEQFNQNHSPPKNTFLKSYCQISPSTRFNQNSTGIKCYRKM